MVFVLNVLAFVLIGLQIRPILEHLEPAVHARGISIVSLAALDDASSPAIAWVMTVQHAGPQTARAGAHPPLSLEPATEQCVHSA